MRGQLRGGRCSRASSGPFTAGTAVLLHGAGPRLARGVPQAHRAISLVADRVLQQSGAATRAKVQALLAGDKTKMGTKTDIASEATWADVLRDKSEEARHATTPWHSNTRFNHDNPDLNAAYFWPYRSCRRAIRQAAAGRCIGWSTRSSSSIQGIAGSGHPARRTALGAAVRVEPGRGSGARPASISIDRGDQGGHCVASADQLRPQPVRLSTLVGKRRW